MFLGATSDASAGHDLLALDYADAPGQIPLTCLDSPAPGECWRSDTPVQGGQFAGFDYRRNATLAFARLHVDDGGDIEAAAERAYTGLAELSRHLELAHPLRIWHYLHALNAGAGDAERYRRFSVGRARALDAWGLADDSLPAATLVGSNLAGLSLHAILVATPPQPLENPRQVSAYRYPRDYGPRPPAFARAAVMRWPGGPATLMISGTASIVGHRSLHPDDFTGQLDETLANIDALLEQAREQVGPLTLADLRQVKVYLRHREHAAAARRRLAPLLGARTQLVLLQAGLCRRELLVEIEALAEVAPD